MKWLALKLVKLLGWRVIGEMPDDPKMVIIAAPHTSNWDYVLFLGVIAHFHLDVRVLIKESVFWGPLGAMLRHFGGSPLIEASHTRWYRPPHRRSQMQSVSCS